MSSSKKRKIKMKGSKTTDYIDSISANGNQCSKLKAWAQRPIVSDCSSVDRVLASEAKGRGFDPRQSHQVFASNAASSQQHPQTLNMNPLNILFLCTHNSARSILAEAMMNHLSDGQWRAYSAGSSPRDNQQPNPLALKVLGQAGVSIDGLHSKSWDVFAAPNAPHMHLVITVCDSAAGEVCPFWPGQPATAHWGYADPSEALGDMAQKETAFMQTLELMRPRLQKLMRLPASSMNAATLQASARALAES
jgi:arsenate reductase (thioredoxin)